MKAINHNIRLTSAALLAMVLGSYLYSNSADAAERIGGNVSKVNSSIYIAQGNQVGNVSTVNGSVELDVGATAGNVDTVNGSIMIADDVTILSAETVNGRIELEQRVNVQRSLSTVNGRIELAGESHVGEKVSTVNGSIRLTNATVADNIETRSGDITVQDGSVVEGDIIVKRNRHSWLGGLFSFGNDEPDIEIDASSSVRGDIHLYQETNLYIDDGADIGEVIHHY